MSESLRDQLLKAGFRPSSKPDRREHAVRKPTSRKRGGSAELDLAQAFALRATAERTERETAEREAGAQAAARKERKRKLQELLAGNALNRVDAEQPRNFEFAGKIRRVYVTQEQLAPLNAGDLGVVMQGGHALLVNREVALAVQALAPETVALLVDPNAATVDDGVPDDLIW